MVTICDYELKKENIKLGDMIYKKSNACENIQREINIMLAPDNNYVKHCAVVMASILLNCDRTSSLNFFIMDFDITDANKNFLKSLTKIRPFNITFLDVSNFDFSMLPLNRDHIKVPSTYYRLVVCELVPKNIDKILYLDCDVIVEKDLKELFDIDLDKYLAGTVEDECAIINSLRLGLNYYFNSGVILFNVKKLRNFDLYNKCLQYFNENKNLITLQDQDILNGVLSEKCKKLHLKWNASTPIFENSVWKQDASFHEKLQAAIEPGIIHYTFTPKPWQKKCTHILKDEYLKYLRIVDPENYDKLTKEKFINKFFKKEKTKTHRIYTIFGIKIKTKRKSKKDIIKEDLENIMIQLSQINSKLDKMNK